MLQDLGVLSALGVEASLYDRVGYSPNQTGLAVLSHRRKIRVEDGLHAIHEYQTRQALMVLSQMFRGRRSLGT